MTDLSPQRWQQVRRVFDAAAELPADDRELFLARSCGDDGELRREVESLLAAHDGAGTFIDRPALRLAEPTGGEDGEISPDSPPDLDRVGPYRVLRCIGRGGMGVVYLAERNDEAFEKRVAVKVLKRGLDSDEVMRRFRGERQILADLDHPHICKLLDGGNTPDARPYLVMEHVDGEPIDEHCDGRALTVGARLRLFQKVCRAVHFAHQRLVVHRDLKPSNVLITAAGEPKLLDFGIAKLLDPAEFPHTVQQTQPGSALMTPLYASPEQVAGGRITTASDVYALGVVLYQLLCGRPPYDLDGLPRDEHLQAIRQQRPLKPSDAAVTEARLRRPDGTTTTLSPQQASARRGVEPRRLKRRLAGDLDNIVLTALRREPERRYASAEQLADDVGRHLDGLPVIARADTFAYRTGKFLRRHRAAAVSVAAALALLVGLTVSLWLQRRAVLDQRDRAAAVSSYLTELFEHPDPARSLGRSVTAREVLDRGARRIGLDLEDRPELFSALATTMGRSYKGLGDYAEADRLLESALAVLEARHGEEHPEVASILHHLAENRAFQGRYEEAERLGLRALALRRRLLGSQDPAVAETLLRLGRVAELTARWQDARERYDEALTIARSGSADGTDGNPELEAAVLNRYAILHMELGEDGEAETMLRQALALQERRYGDRHPDLALTLNELGRLLGRHDPAAGEAELRRALALQRRLFDGDHPDLISTLNNLGHLLRSQGRLADSESALAEAVAMADQVYEGPSGVHAAAIDNLALLRHDQGRFAEAETLRRRSLAMLERLHGRDHPDVAYSLANLARDLVALDRRDEAEALFGEALAISRAHLGDSHERVAVIQNNLGDLAYRRQDLAAARGLYAGAIDTLRAALGADHPKVAVALYNLANLESDAGERDSAEARYREAIAIAEAALGPDHLNLAFMRTGLAWLLNATGRPAEALELAGGALATFEAQLPPDSLWRASALRAVGEGLLLSGRYAEAEPKLVAAGDLFLALRGPDGRQTRETRELLARLREKSPHSVGGSGS